MSEEMKTCPSCNSPYDYATGEELYACPDCSFEWNPNEEYQEDGLVVKDSNGAIL
jgi:protein PhnA